MLHYKNRHYLCSINLQEKIVQNYCLLKKNHIFHPYILNALLSFTTFMSQWRQVKIPTFVFVMLRDLLGSADNPMSKRFCAADLLSSQARLIGSLYNIKKCVIVIG